MENYTYAAKSGDERGIKEATTLYGNAKHLIVITNDVICGAKEDFNVDIVGEG